MEQAENNIRKDFTASERVEIARRIEVALAGRHGVRHDSDMQTFAPLEKGASRDIAAKSVGWSGGTVKTSTQKRMCKHLQLLIRETPETALAGRNHRPKEVDKHLPTYTKEDVQTFADPDSGNSRDIAAKSVGWSGETYRKAKKVIESGDEKLKESVDSGEMSVNRAYKQATQKTTPKTITVRLAYSIAEDASSIITRAGGDYATKLALEILKREGHEVHHDQH